MDSGRTLESKAAHIGGEFHLSCYYVIIGPVNSRMAALLRLPDTPVGCGGRSASPRIYHRLEARFPDHNGFLPCGGKVPCIPDGVEKCTRDYLRLRLASILQRFLGRRTTAGNAVLQRELRSPCFERLGSVDESHAPPLDPRHRTESTIDSDNIVPASV
ncbi:uncharacterized protein LOC142573305 [Dermacentor variabilis]|uniref:uncharacterized protein LOC142573305 n=1 Tax=Dermacentor variabilis TaxID=34621 RepID=UPI003F5CAE86